jgi:branched-subunit amino acid ABC-type transport system permease component
VHLFLTYTVFGLVLGGVYGIAASGLVLTYNTSGIFNFAHGAEAMLGAFVYWQVRYGWGWPAPLAIVVVIGIFGPLMGYAIYLAIMRGLRDTAEVTKVVVTVALMLGMLYLADWFWNPTQARTVEPFFGPNSIIHIFGATVTTHEIIALGVAIAIAIGLRLFFYRTRTGVAMRGVVDDPSLLQLNGLNPERMAALSWAMGSFLAVLAGVLVTPIGGGALAATSLTLLVIDAFAAAVFGRLRSVPRTFIGALVLGLGANYILAYFPTSWSWASDFRVSFPMVVLFVVLIVLPQDRLRGATVLRTRERFRVPSVRSAAIAAVGLVAVVILLRQLMVATDVTTLTIGLSFSVIALSLTLLTGYAGEMNLAAVSFGAIATMVLFHNGVNGHGLAARTTLWGILLGVVVTAVVGALVSLPALRLRGLYLGLATFAFGVFLTDMVLLDSSPHKLPLLHTRFSLFSGGAGINTLVIPPLKVGPLDLKNPTTFLMTVTVVFAVIGVGLVALRNSGYGRRLAAMKDSPAASATLGQSLLKLKLSVFMISAAIAGLGGILMSMALGSVTPDNFDIFLSLSLLMLTVVAGIGYVSGALFGGLLSGVGFGLVVTTFDNLASNYNGLHGLFTFLAHFAAVSPALIGISLGRNPTGAIHDVVLGYREMRHRYGLLAGGLAAEAVFYVLALTGAFGNWSFAILTIALIFGLPAIAQMTSKEAAEKRAAEIPLEMAGIDSLYTDNMRSELDRSLGIEDEVKLYRQFATVPAGRVADGAEGVSASGSGTRSEQPVSGGAGDAGT